MKKTVLFSAFLIGVYYISCLSAKELAQIGGGKFDR